MNRLCDKKKPIIISGFIRGFLVNSGIKISQLLKKLVDQLPTVYLAAYVMLHDLVDIMILTCFYMLKIASDDNFYLLLEKTTSI